MLTEDFIKKTRAIAYFIIGTLDDDDFPSVSRVCCAQAEKNCDVLISMLEDIRRRINAYIKYLCTLRDSPDL